MIDVFLCLDLYAFTVFKGKLGEMRATERERERCGEQDKHIDEWMKAMVIWWKEYRTTERTRDFTHMSEQTDEWKERKGKENEWTYPNCNEQQGI